MPQQDHDPRHLLQELGRQRFRHGPHPLRPAFPGPYHVERSRRSLCILRLLCFFPFRPLSFPLRRGRRNANPPSPAPPTAASTRSSPCSPKTPPSSSAEPKSPRKSASPASKSGAGSKSSAPSA